MVELLGKIARDTTGTAAVEYAVVAAAVGVASFSSVVALAVETTNNMTDAAVSYAEAQEESAK